jgi:hypothetical protein
VLSLESVVQRAACALAGALLIFSGIGAQVLNSSSAARAYQVAPAQHGGRLEFAFGDIELAIAPSWTVSYDEGGGSSPIAQRNLPWSWSPLPPPARATPRGRRAVVDQRRRPYWRGTRQWHG